MRDRILLFNIFYNLENNKFRKESSLKKHVVWISIGWLRNGCCWASRSNGIKDNAQSSAKHGKCYEEHAEP